MQSFAKPNKAVAAVAVLLWIVLFSPRAQATTYTLAPSSTLLTAGKFATVVPTATTQLYALEGDLKFTSTFVDRMGSEKATFVWQTSAPDAVSVRWQVALIAPKANLWHWNNTPFLVRDGVGTGAAAYTFGNFVIDFAKFDPFKKTTTSTSTTTSGTSIGTSLGGTLATVELGGPAYASVPKMDPVTLYVRAIPLRADGNPAAQPSPVVTIKFGSYTPKIASIPASPSLNVNIAAVTAGHNETMDSADHLLVTQAMGFFLPNDKLTLGHSSGFVDGLVELVGSAFHFFADVYSYAADAWESVRQAAIKVAAAPMAAVGCGDPCQQATSWAVDAALVAAGVPPHMPSVDALAEGGIDYLAAVAADSMGVGPLGKDAAAAFAKAFVSEIKNQANGGGDPSRWYRPDPDYQWAPTVITVTVKNPNAFKSPRAQLTYTDSLGLFDGTTWPMLIPALDPGQVLTLRIALRPKGAVDGWKRTVQDAIRAMQSGNLTAGATLLNKAQGELAAVSAKYFSGTPTVTIMVANESSPYSGMFGISLGSTAYYGSKAVPLGVTKAL